jgi:hypothetical protein
MKFIWKGRWRNGEIVIEAESLQELENALNSLLSKGEIQMDSPIIEERFPIIHGVAGCSEAIKLLMETEWGKKPRSMNEIKQALEANAFYFSKGTLSGTLTMMVKKGKLKRFKEDGHWKYLLEK